MTYTVSSGTLNSSIPYHTIPCGTPAAIHPKTCDKQAVIAVISPVPHLCITLMCSSSDNCMAKFALSDCKQQGKIINDGWWSSSFITVMKFLSHTKLGVQSWNLGCQTIPCSNVEPPLLMWHIIVVTLSCFLLSVRLGMPLMFWHGWVTEGYPTCKNLAPTILKGSLI